MKKLSFLFCFLLITVSINSLAQSSLDLDKTKNLSGIAGYNPLYQEGSVFSDGLNLKSGSVFNSLTNNPNEYGQYWVTRLDSMMVDSSAKYYYTYNNDGRLVQKIHYAWNLSGVFNLAYKTIYDYESHGHISNQEMWRWDPNNLIYYGSTKESYEYSSEGDLLNHVVYNWLPGINTWGFKTKMTYEYLNNSASVNRLYYTYNANSEEWGVKEKCEEDYDENGNLLSMVIYFIDYNTNNFYPVRRDTYAYNSNHDLIEESLYYWENEINDWDIRQKKVIDYTANNKIEQEIIYSKSYDETALINYSRMDYDYSNAGKDVNLVSKLWDSEIQEWYMVHEGSLKYDDFDNQIFVEHYSYDRDYNITDSSKFVDTYVPLEENHTLVATYKNLNSKLVTSTQELYENGVEVWDFTSDLYYTNTVLPIDTLHVNTDNCAIDYLQEIDSVFVMESSREGDQLYLNIELYQNGIASYQEISTPCNKPGYYSLSLELSCDDASLSSFVNLVEAKKQTGVDQSEAGIELFPNPSSGNITLNFLDLGSPAYFILHNTQGILLKEYSVSSGETIPTNEYPPGVYLYSIFVGNEKHTGKLIIE